MKNYCLKLKFCRITVLILFFYSYLDHQNRVNGSNEQEFVFSEGVFQLNETIEKFSK